MKTLKSKTKITKATLRSFARRNEGKLYAKEVSSFDGMSDIVEANTKAKFQPTEINNDKKNYYQTGIQGIYTVQGSGNMYNLYENDTYEGIEVYNCCGTTILAIKK